ncbi:MAG: hypothetical protein KF775_18535 [Cyclobacteriaceae bacterium]|nr:hypothetical protein [Cyclobacteriaceae bacterium]
MNTSFTPVSYDYREIIEEAIDQRKSGRIFFFNNDVQLDSADGQIISLTEHKNSGWFIHLEPEHQIRIDRIITIFGKPGPAYDEYDAYANACLDCKGGYDL